MPTGLRITAFFNFAINYSLQRFDLPRRISDFLLQSRALVLSFRVPTAPTMKAEEVYMIMTNCKSGLVFFTGAVLWTLSLVGVASAQSQRTIDAGTTITVRTNEAMNANSSDGRIFSGVVDQDVVDRGGSVAIPRGSNVELLVRTISKNQVDLDLDPVTVDGQRYGMQTENTVVTQPSDGIGANKRTGVFVGGGAAI